MKENKIAIKLTVVLVTETYSCLDSNMVITGSTGGSQNNTVCVWELGGIDGNDNRDEYSKTRMEMCQIESVKTMSMWNESTEVLCRK